MDVADINMNDEDSVEEVINGYEDDVADDQPSALLLSMVSPSDNDVPTAGSPSFTTPSILTCPSSSSRSLPSTQSAPAMISRTSNPAPCSSLPSPQSVSAAFAHSSIQAPPNTSRRTQPSKRKRDSTDILLDNIDRQLEKKITPTEHFLLSLASQLDNVPEHLQGYCKIHLLDVLIQYQTGEIPTALMQVQKP